MMSAFDVRIFFGTTGDQKDYRVDKSSTASFAMRQALIKASNEGHTGPVQVSVVGVETEPGKMRVAIHPIRHDYVLASSAWTNEDNIASFRQGWSIFLGDNTHWKIQKLDFPEEVNAEVEDPEGKIDNYEYKGPTFKNDAEAARFVQRQANEGDLTCRKAIEFLLMVKSLQVTSLGLKRGW